MATDVRTEAARYAASLPLPDNRPNGDEQLYPNLLASYSKGLPHNELGEVQPEAYAALVQALSTGNPDDFELIPLGGARKLIHPLGGFSFELNGPDPQHTFMATPPAFASAEAAGEMVELYWQALTRDVHFDEYETHPLTLRAAEALSALSEYKGRKDNGRVTPRTLFRGTLAGDGTGPFISQFLLKDCAYGIQSLKQQGRVTVPGADKVTSYEEWLRVQNGASTAPNTYDSVPRYLRNGRDLAEFFHADLPFQAYLNAYMILLTSRASVDANHPYIPSKTQSGNATFGGSHIAPLMCAVVPRALKAVLYHKWNVHRRLRPETFGGRVHNHRVGAASYPVHPELLDNAVLDEVFSKYGTYLLPLAYPEGSPLHPSYGAAHASIAGACVTILKAFFNESFVLPSPVKVSADGLSLVPYEGEPLTVGGELNKLASNCSLGRVISGVHFRSDCQEALLMGEAVGIQVLREERLTYPERFVGFSLTKFDGTTITV
jgi:hypothetical protein